MEITISFGSYFFRNENQIYLDGGFCVPGNIPLKLSIITGNQKQLVLLNAEKSKL